MSRTVIREALRQLETEGLVASIANKGLVVRELTVAEAEVFMPFAVCWSALRHNCS